MHVRHVEELGYHNRYFKRRTLQFVIEREASVVEGAVPPAHSKAVLRGLAELGLRRPPGGPALEELFARAPRDAGVLAGALTARLQTAAHPGVWAFGSLPAQENHFSFYVEAADPTFLRSCAQPALELTALLLAATPERVEGAEAAVAQILGRFREDGTNTALSHNMREILAKAEAQGIPWKRATARAAHVVLGQGRKRRYYNGVMCDLDSLVSFEISRNKLLCHRMLATAGLPVPVAAEVRNERQVRETIKAIGFPMVVKPNSMNKGTGVVVGIESEEELLQAFAAASSYGTGVLVEGMIPGDDHRLLVVDGRFVAASLRRPAQVVGDGTRSLRALIEEANADPRRSRKEVTVLAEIEIDSDSERQLARQGLTLDSVPAEGQAVRLKGTANIATGGSGEDVTEKVHPDNAAMAENAARTVGLGLAGIDFITGDISRSYREVGGAICEVNTSISLAPHRAADPSRDVITPLLRRSFAAGDDGRIPIAAVTGSGKLAEIVRGLADILNATGTVCGDTSAEGARVAGQRVTAGKLDSYRGAEILLNDPDCAAAAIALDPENVAQRGLAFDRCTVAGLFGLSQLQGEARAAALRLLDAADTLVLPADDLAALEAAAAAEGKRLLLVGGDGEPRRLDEGATAFLAEGKGRKRELVFRSGDRRQAILPAGELPERKDLASCLAAIALAYGLGQPLDAIAAALPVTLESAPA